MSDTLAYDYEDEPPSDLTPWMPPASAYSEGPTLGEANPISAYLRRRHQVATLRMPGAPIDSSATTKPKLPGIDYVRYGTGPTIIGAASGASNIISTLARVGAGNVAPIAGNTSPWFILDGGAGTVTLFEVGYGVSNTQRVALDSLWTPVVDRLKGYEQYAADDWDGYGAQAITHETVAAARRFLRAVPRVYGLPDIAPGADGTIGLEWRFASRPIRKLFIDIGPGGVWKGFCRKASGEHQVFPDKVMGPHIQHDVARFFRSLEA